MHVWDSQRYQEDGAAYCPAHDVVSETITSHGVWEVRETILTLAVCEAEANGILIDFGAQVGWFSMLAASCGRVVLAVEADAENVRLLRRNARQNGWEDLIAVSHQEISGSTRPLSSAGPIRLAKLDIEGAECHAIRMLWPAITAGLVDHLLVEVSPVFADYYPRLVADLIGVGFEVYLLPPKDHPPRDVYPPTDALAPWRLDRQDPEMLARTVAGWRQENLWFRRPGAAW